MKSMVAWASPQAFKNKPEGQLNKLFQTINKKVLTRRRPYLRRKNFAWHEISRRRKNFAWHEITTDEEISLWSCLPAKWLKPLLRAKSQELRAKPKGFLVAEGKVDGKFGVIVRDLQRRGKVIY